MVVGSRGIVWIHRVFGLDGAVRWGILVRQGWYQLACCVFQCRIVLQMFGLEALGGACDVVVKGHGVLLKLGFH